MELTRDIRDQAELTQIRDDVRAHGGLTIPMGDLAPPKLFEAVHVALRFCGKPFAEVSGQIVQLMPGGQAAVLVDEDNRSRLEASPEKSTVALPLWAKIAAMSKGEKIKLAKHGAVDARRLLLKDADPSLHLQVLNNPGITASEVAALIKGGAASAAFVRGVLARTELVGNTAVAEALVLSPKTPTADAIKLMNKVSLDLARRLAKTGGVRGPLLRAAKKRVTRTRS